MIHYSTQEARWRAIKDRDNDAADAFYYAVKTTGIFCIPGCPSRLPRPENIEFFDTAALAMQAGYRPCKRCRPDDPAHRDIASERIINACRTIETTGHSPSLSDLAATAGLSPSHFQRLFKQRVGISPKEYGQAVRETRIRRALEQGHPVTRAIFDAGYGASSRFYERSRQTLGMEASTYVKGGKGITIRYAYAESFLGPVLAAFTKKGICAVEFGDTPESLAAALRARFPQAHILDDNETLQPLLREVTDFIQSPELGLDLPSDIQGTAFQQRVWQALQSIPCGETRSYSEVAHTVARPLAIRAVAAACAANPLAVVIPCHRVVRKSGDLAGYKWGLDKKKALLENEQGKK